MLLYFHNEALFTTSFTMYEICYKHNIQTSLIHPSPDIQTCMHQQEETLLQVRKIFQATSSAILLMLMIIIVTNK